MTTEGIIILPCAVNFTIALFDQFSGEGIDFMNERRCVKMLRNIIDINFLYELMLGIYLPTPSNESNSRRLVNLSRLVIDRYATLHPTCSPIVFSVEKQHFIVFGVYCLDTQKLH